MPRTNRSLDSRALADALDLTIETIQKLTREKRIPYTIHQGQYRYTPDDVVAALTGLNIREDRPQ